LAQTLPSDTTTKPVAQANDVRPKIPAVAVQINQRLTSTEEALSQQHAVPVAANTICS
jgi:hypothetical protein